MREYPHNIVFIEIVTLHYLYAVALYPFQEYELVYTEVAYYLSEESKGKFAYRVEPYESTDTRIHFLNRYGSVSATERMYPMAFFYGIGHDRCSLGNVFLLSVFNLGHHAAGIFQPL